METLIADLAWAGGYLDGEGCFRIATSTSRGRAAYPCSPQVAVSSTQLLPLQQLVALFGGAIHTQRTATAKHKACFQWCVHGQRAKDVSEAVEPFMFEKREQAAMVALYPGVKKDRALSYLIYDWLRKTKTRGY